MWNVMLLWRLLVALRIVLTLVPQTGYIHPDEFFQSVEVVAGDILDLRVDLPWEFNRSSSSEPPIRNILIPYVVVGMPLYFLKCLSDLSELFLDVTLLSPYLVLMLPRLTMTFLSLFTDSCLRRLCKLSGRNHLRCLCVYASSQVVLVFLTRTLSNSIEYFLFVALLSMVADDLRDIDRQKRFHETKEDAHLTDQRSHWLGAITAIGFFNRPTFVAFAFVPLVIWLLYGLDRTGLNLRRVLERCLSLLPAFVVTSTAMVVVDTAYYGQVSDVFRWSELPNIVWIVTPMNFIAYNLSGSNLLQHGLHPRYVHLLVNNVLLFGLLGVIGLAAYFKMLYATVVKRQSQSQQQPSDKLAVVLDKMCACSFAFPILLLSLAPHQEPRFIIPVLFPLAFLHADQLASSRWTVASWIALNVVGCAFFGFVHQAGVVPSLIHLQRSTLVRDGPLTHVDHVVYYHTYMPPMSLLLRLKRTRDCHVQPELEVHDLMGSPPDQLHRDLDRLRGSVVVVSPTSLRESVVDAAKPYDASLLTRFWMHLSLEDPPPLDAHLLDRIGLDMHLVQIWKNITRVQYLSAV